jgi:hypothetical protein
MADILKLAGTIENQFSIGLNQSVFIRNNAGRIEVKHNDSDWFEVEFRRVIATTEEILTGTDAAKVPSPDSMMEITAAACLANMGFR